MDLFSGLTVFTGETGSGKSLLIDALGLLAGTRATPSLVRSSTDRATVEALFEISPDLAVVRRLSELGLDSDNPGDDVILRREVQLSGRGRAAINGHLVPGSQLADISAHLFELSSQHEHHALLDASAQREFFDGFAQLAPLRQTVAREYHSLRAALSQSDALATSDRDREQRRDFLRFQVEELEALALEPGESARLETERQRLAHTEQLLERGSAAQAALSDGADGESSALDLLGIALNAADEMAEHDATLKPLLESLHEAQSRLADASFELGRYLGRLEADPAHLADINDRLDAIRKALRKHGPTEAHAQEQLLAMKAELETLENWDSSRAAAEEQVRARKAALLAAALELRRAREKAKAKFLRPLVSLLKDFAMPKVRVELLLQPLTSGVPVDASGVLCGPAGLDDVELLFSANEGEPLQPLRKVASGGELSRVMLALRTLEAQNGQVPLLIFDEVDAGISGTAARRVAERLAALGERCQVLCVTHNPSIAAAANHHFIVEKKQVAGRTVSTVTMAEGLRRQSELARLLDGGKQSEKGMALAGELLEAAG